MSSSHGADGQPPPLPCPREPSSPCTRKVCPRCKRELGRYSFWIGEVLIETWSCIEHGDIQPRRGVTGNLSLPGGNTLP